MSWPFRISPMTCSGRSNRSRYSARRSAGRLMGGFLGWGDAVHHGDFPPPGPHPARLGERFRTRPGCPRFLPSGVSNDVAPGENSERPFFQLDQGYIYQSVRCWPDLCLIRGLVLRGSAGQFAIGRLCKPLRIQRADHGYACRQYGANRLGALRRPVFLSGRNARSQPRTFPPFPATALFLSNALEFP